MNEPAIKMDEASVLRLRRDLWLVFITCMLMIIWVPIRTYLYGLNMDTLLGDFLWGYPIRIFSGLYENLQGLTEKYG